MLLYLFVDIRIELNDIMKMSLNMNTRVKLNNGVEMPIFGLGVYRAESGGDDLVNLIKYAIQNACYRMLDSAQFYGNDEEIGRAIRECGLPREHLFVTTKLFTTKDGRAAAKETVETSLKQMNIDYIDQYLLHAPQGGRVLECYDVLLEYQNRGLLKSIGVSNFGLEHLEAMKNSGRPLPQVNQIELHPWCTQAPIVNWCRAHQIQIVGYAPLAQSQKLTHPFVLEMSSKYKKSPAQILIRYSLQKGFVTIPKSTKPLRLLENSNVFNFEFDTNDMNIFDSFGRQKKENVCWDPTTNDLETQFGPLV